MGRAHDPTTHGPTVTFMTRRNTTDGIWEKYDLLGDGRNTTCWEMGEIRHWDMGEIRPTGTWEKYDLLGEIRLTTSPSPSGDPAVGFGVDRIRRDLTSSWVSLHCPRDRDDGDIVRGEAWAHVVIRML
jgi:hypothetical protein